MIRGQISIEDLERELGFTFRNKNKVADFLNNMPPPSPAERAFQVETLKRHTEQALHMLPQKHFGEWPYSNNTIHVIMKDLFDNEAILNYLGCFGASFTPNPDPDTFVPQHDDVLCILQALRRDRNENAFLNWLRNKLTLIMPIILPYLPYKMTLELDFLSRERFRLLEDQVQSQKKNNELSEEIIKLKAELFEKDTELKAQHDAASEDKEKLLEQIEHQKILGAMLQDDQTSTLSIAASLFNPPSEPPSSAKDRLPPPLVPRAEYKK
ncbi:MAG: hypothetical protein V4496_00345 [Pseudomonadota bacterium]